MRQTRWLRSVQMSGQGARDMVSFLDQANSERLLRPMATEVMEKFSLLYSFVFCSDCSGSAACHLAPFQFVGCLLPGLPQLPMPLLVVDPDSGIA